MNKSLRILHLEDNAADAELVARELKKAGIAGDKLVVSNRNDFVNALRNFSPDIIISDHSLPSFDSHEALEIVKEMNIQIPFILVTATVSEEYAVTIIKEGAVDYILKDRLQRLPNAIWSAIDKFNLERENKIANEILRASEKKYKLLFEGNPMPMWMIEKSTLDIIAVNGAAIDHYGYSREEFLKLNSKDLRPGEDVQDYLIFLNRDFSGKSSKRTWRHKKKNGTVIMAEIIAHDITYENIPAILILANDVTEKLQAEAALARQRTMQQKLITETSIQVQEREREEIGRELHDNINQVLAAAKMYLDYAIRKDNLHSERLEQSRQNIIVAIEEIRKLSQTLVPPSLGETTLVEAIELLLDMIRLASPFDLTFETENYDEEAMDNDIKLMFYRIVQEQINNIMKHAKAKRVIVKISMNTKEIFLSIRDNGTGFDASKQVTGIGLRNINNRVGFYDGTSRIVSSPGKGCILEVKVPLKKVLVER